MTAHPAVRRVRTLSRLLDDAVRLPGTDRRVGLDPLVGLLPVGGDALGLAVSLYPVAEAVRHGVPRRVLARMLVNVGVDAVGGTVPLLGVVFDAAWKANARNLALLERHLE